MEEETIKRLDCPLVEVVLVYKKMLAQSRWSDTDITYRTFFLLHLRATPRGYISCSVGEGVGPERVATIVGGGTVDERPELVKYLVEGVGPERVHFR